MIQKLLLLIATFAQIFPRCWQNKKVACCLILLFASSCSTYKQATHHYHEGRLEKAEASLKKADLPYAASKNSSLLLLDRALIRFAQGKTKESCHDFQKALSSIDYYRKITPTELALQTLLEDSTGAYIPPPFEKQLAYLYYAFALFQEGDEENATALLSYLENHRQEEEEENPIATYMLALALDRRGDVSNAEILLRRIGIDGPLSSTLTIVHAGRSPEKISYLSPISVVSLVALEELLGVSGIKPALSSLVGIPLPKLAYFSQVRPPLSPLITFDIGKAAKNHLEKEEPTIALRAAARLLLRRGLIAAYAKEHTLLDIGMGVANLTTKADTRSWGCLPEKIYLCVPDNAKKTLPLDVKKEELKIVHLFEEPL